MNVMRPTSGGFKKEVNGLTLKASYEGHPLRAYVTLDRLHVEPLQLTLNTIEQIRDLRYMLECLERDYTGEVV